MCLGERQSEKLYQDKNKQTKLTSVELVSLGTRLSVHYLIQSKNIPLKMTGQQQMKEATKNTRAVQKQFSLCQHNKNSYMAGSFLDSPHITEIQDKKRDKERVNKCIKLQSFVTTWLCKFSCLWRQHVAVERTKVASPILDLIIISNSYWKCDLSQVTKSCWASISPSVKWR